MKKVDRVMMQHVASILRVFADYLEKYVEEELAEEEER